ncbi:PAS domain-containing protein [Flavivirga aquimarina]|uniref:PAS domain-containing protein n=1 Tax=Flavivirga aquimarina TaxID=2027862 RepID=A0ABT8WCV9_9FLAO|nr:PAS domain-containing protein [Flavivirga aquimarina]MDO5970993.1 PAS domain-containing protein [Flavivirga aquimarina]
MKKKPHLLRGPLKCWDIFSMHLVEQATDFMKHEEIEVLNSFKNKFDWSFDVETIITNKEFQALVLTDFKQEIQWVNKGFTKMTGYSAKYAKGKKPNFLQGKDTSPKTLNNIRGYLKEDIHFKETIANYRKNGEMYYCNIEIYPLKDATNATTHLLALEKEVRL